MKTRIVNCLVVIILLWTVLSCSTVKKINVKIEPKSHDFGQVNISYSVTFDFVLTNKKSVDISITVFTFDTIEFSETGGNSLGKLIASKDTHTITVGFAPSMPAGLKSDILHIEWVDTNQKTGKLDVGLAGEAVAVPKIEVSPDIYDFGVVFTGSMKTSDFIIENPGTADLVISAFNFAGNAAYFSISAGGNTPISVNPGIPHTFTVRFEPTLGGAFPTYLQITHNAVNSTPPFIITIDAEGLVPIPIFNIYPRTYDFGNVSNTSSKTQNFRIENTGNADLNITAINFTGTNAADFKITGTNAPFAVTPSASKSITVEFAPTSIGAKTATMEIEHNAASSPDMVQLSGTGIVANGSNGYTKTNITVGLNSISSTGREISPGLTYLDDGRYQVNIGFDIWFYGRSYNTAWVCTNSWVSFGSDPGTNTYTNSVLPNAALPNAVIYPYWDDTVFAQTNWPEARWVYEVQGSAPNRIFVVEWYHFRHLATTTNSKLTYQVRVYETSNVIEICYPADVPPSNDWIVYSSDSATIGIENENGSQANMVTSNETSKPTSNYRFTPN